MMFNPLKAELIDQIVRAVRVDKSGEMYGVVESIVGDIVTIRLMSGGDIPLLLTRKISYENTVFTILKEDKKGD